MGSDLDSKIQKLKAEAYLALYYYRDIVYVLGVLVAVLTNISWSGTEYEVCVMLFLSVVV